MSPSRLRKYVLDTNCFIDAARNAEFRAAFDVFCGEAAPGLYLSSVVAAELRAGAGRSAALLDREVLAPYFRRQRILTLSAQSWNALGTTLATLVAREGLVLSEARRGFIFDILLGHSCREAGATLVSANTRDMTRIAKVFAFDFITPFPKML